MSRRPGSEREDEAEKDAPDGKRRRRHGLRIPSDTVPRPTTVPPVDTAGDERLGTDPALAASIAVSFRDDALDEPPPRRTARLGTEDPFGGRTVVDPIDSARTQELPALRFGTQDDDGPGRTSEPPHAGSAEMSANPASRVLDGEARDGLRDDRDDYDDYDGGGDDDDGGVDASAHASTNGTRPGSSGDSIEISLDDDELPSGAAPVVAGGQRAATMALSDDEIEELMVEARAQTPNAVRSRAERTTDLPAQQTRVDSTTEIDEGELIEAREPSSSSDRDAYRRQDSDDEFDNEDDDDDHEVEVSFGDPTVEVGDDDSAYAVSDTEVVGGDADADDSGAAGAGALSARRANRDSGEVTILSPEDAESIDEDVPDVDEDEPEISIDGGDLDGGAGAADLAANATDGADGAGAPAETADGSSVRGPLEGSDSGEILTADIIEEGGGVKAPPPPPPAAATAAKGPPPAPALAKPAAPVVAAKPKRKGKPWFEEVFDEDYLRTLPFLTPQATQAEAQFVSDSLGLDAGKQILDVGCGYGRHAMEFAARGYHVVGLDASLPLLLRGADEAQRRALDINFVHGDMREMEFEAQFDGAYCLFSTFGYFDDETNKQTAQGISRALKPGARLVIEVLNRDYLVADLPTRVWWEGDGCVVLEEVDFNYFSSRIVSNRSVVFDDGRQLEQEISIRAYSLHEFGKLLHAAGFRVVEISGSMAHRGRFFGGNSRQILVVAEKRHKRGETQGDPRGA